MFHVKPVQIATGPLAGLTLPDSHLKVPRDLRKYYWDYQLAYTAQERAAAGMRYFAAKAHYERVRENNTARREGAPG